MFKFILFLTMTMWLHYATASTYIKNQSLIEDVTLTATAGGTTTLNKDSQTNQVFTGALSQTVTLPDATTVPTGIRYYISNESTGVLTINAFGGGLIKVIGSQAATSIRLKTNSVAAGTWNVDDGSVPSTTFTLGSIIFAGTGGVFSESNSDFFWDNTNKRLGIGTSAPNSQININGGAGTTNLSLQNSSTGSTGSDGFFLGYPAASSTLVLDQKEPAGIRINTTSLMRMFISNNTFIGIGNSFWPAASLHINDSGATALALKVGNSNTGYTSTDGFNFGITTTGAGEIRQYENLDISLYTNNTERVRYLSGGNTNFLNGVTFSAALGNVVSNGAGIDIWNGTMAMILGGDNNLNTRTDATSKVTRVGSFHYTNAEEPLGLLVAVSNSSTSQITIGGGSGVVNAATNVIINTASTNTTVSGTQRLAALSNGSVIVGDGSNALSTSATTGFLYIPTSAGTPTGTPSTASAVGVSPIQVDTTNNQLMFYSGGSWRTSNEAQFYVNATMEGGNFDLGNASVASYTEITNSDIVLTPISGSSAVGVMCSGTNAATAPSTSPTSCAAGSESLGINFTISKAGVYEVCSYFTHAMTVDSGVTVVSAFQLIETPTNAQTLTLEGGSKMTSALAGMTIATGTNQGAQHPNTNCSVFNWTAKANGATVGVRLMYEQSVIGTPDDSLIQADGSTSFGQRNVRWTVKRF